MASTAGVRRLTALALATGTLVAASAGSAGAATSTHKDVYTATGGGSVIHLVLNLPVAIPSIGSTITQDLVLTGTNTRSSSFTDAALAKTQAILGANGNVPVVSAALEKSVVAEFGKAQPADIGTLPANPLITGGVLQLSSHANDPDAVGTVAHSLSSVADLKIAGAGNLQAVLDQVNAQLAGVLDQVVGTLANGSSAAPLAGVPQVTDLVNTLVAQLNAQTQGAAQPVADAVQAVVAQLKALPQKLALQLKAATADPSLVHIGLVQSEQTVTRTASAVTSHVQNDLTNISLLGGLVKVAGMTSDSTATLGSTASDAAAHGTSSILQANVADLVTAQVTGDLTAALGGSAVPVQVKDAVNGALAQVTGLLNSALGATLTGPKVGAPTKTPTDAKQSVDAAHLVVQPVGLAKPLIDLSLVPATAEVSKVVAQQVTQATPVNVVHNLPRTGGNLPLTGAIATALLGAAAVVRRRRAHV